MCICKRCKIEFINTLSKKYLIEDNERYNLCPYCRKYRLCKNCGVEFHHKQNQTCSKQCAQELKEKSFMLSCGSKHNFCKNSKSRIEWEKNLLENEGIVNIFQREDVKEKIKKTFFEKYGVDNPSKSEIIKIKKKYTLNKTIKSNPDIFVKNWHIIHEKFIKNIGYDPRLHIFGKASKESLKVFDPLIKWCLNNKIKNDDIYVGVGNKNEYFLKSEENNIFFYDFTIKSKRIIIEFNGVAFHAKPEFLEKNDWFNPFTKESAHDNIEKSKIKYQIAKDKGFEILEIWSDVDIIDNLEICKKFIIDRI